MANTSTRTLRLLSLLQTHRYWPGTELAERLGVSVRTLRRDIDRLRELAIRLRRSAAWTAVRSLPRARRCRHW
jgi:predicted DNA-binding transcriptional regulator YafY